MAAAESSGAVFEALFLFDGGGLLVPGDVLGRRFDFVHNAVRVTIIFPGRDDVPQELGMPSERRGVQKAAHLTAWMPRTGEILAAVIDTFEVRVGVASEEPPTKEVVERSFPIAVEVAERFMAWIRTRGGQYWLPGRHEGLETAGLYGRLVLSETYEEASLEARSFPGSALMARRPDEAITVNALEEVVAATNQGVDPPPEDMLLADAAAAVTEASSAMWKYERRDTARAVLLAAIAAEVKIKGTIRLRAPAELRGVVDVILDNPRDVSIATGQLLDRPMRAILGVSLRENNKQLFKDVTDGLFPLRNRVAHHGYAPRLDEARHAVTTARRLLGWLANL